MTKFNSNTVILSDLDGVILDLNYDIKFWKEWLPAELALKSDKPIEEIRNELEAMMGEQEAGLNWYDLNFWDELLEVDCLEIIKSQQERCTFLEGSLEALQKYLPFPTPNISSPMEILGSFTLNLNQRTSWISLMPICAACKWATRKNKKNFGLWQAFT